MLDDAEVRESFGEDKNTEEGIINALKEELGSV